MLLTIVWSACHTSVYNIVVFLVLLLRGKLIPYNGLLSLGANFPEWWAFNFSRSFPDLEIRDLKK